MTEDKVGEGNVAVGSAFLTTFSHFQKGEFDGLTEEQLVAEFARVVYNRWHRADRNRDGKHASYDTSQSDDGRTHFEPARESTLPEDEAQFLEYFREVVGQTTGQLTAVNPQYLKVIRTILEGPGTQEEIAERCACSQATVARALMWLSNAIYRLQQSGND